MNDSLGVGPYVSFVAFPIVLWLLLSLATRKWRGKRFFAIITGADNRLSLSRLQAFAWTMILFGAYAGAMYGHLMQKQPSLAQIKIARQAHDATVKAAQDEVARAQGALTAAQANGDQQAVKSAQKVLDDKKAALATANAAQVAPPAPFWVQIPLSLLALAGISLASGVFASVISASVDNGPPPSLQSVSGRLKSADTPAAHDPKAKPADGDYWLLIEGTHLGPGGQIRLGGSPARQLFWGDQAIGVDLDENRLPKLLTLDTPAGKTTCLITYQSNPAPATLRLGVEVSDYEPADLIRDDANPRVLALNKFQMLGWTIVAIVAFVILVCKLLGQGVVDSLPEIDKTLVALTGLSQMGYLGGKLVSNSGNK